MKTCLIVDDSRVVRKLARIMLEGYDFECVEAEDGQQALDACGKALPGLILLDWNMPVMDGIEFLARLRALPEGASPKVILCSTHNQLEHIQQALAAGADEYIMKPFDSEIMQAKLQQVGVI
jgi:two-component system chemotaxis response regulator CheY